ncbi:hypothetical protein NEMIN01_0962 [Nematocida minor]|uniref:uncharacterized protein n=1 Tax=Nematocida minor TaxID=1912983 RepID=UPI00221F8896|nr:uncharacterized protein NEMIN01_0962 [Nematocida minor]KAI5190263.1 hypothetical protein NEMIN01_0962 [Nematocida minor]
MEPKVIIIEINGIGVFKVFSTGILFTECTKEEVLNHLTGKLHMFILIASNIDKAAVHKISSYFFRESQIESMSVMYSSVSASLALGAQNIAVVAVDHGPKDSVIWSVDLVQKSSLNYTHSITRTSSYETAVDKMLEYLHSSTYQSATSNIFVRGDKALSEKIREELNKRSVIAAEEENLGDELQVRGYKLACFPKYFTLHMPHNLLPDSDIVYVGAVLTIMINYFEIKEVNTREDFEAGHTKHLLLN